jgi:hypothetical protein
MFMVEKYVQKLDADLRDTADRFDRCSKELEQVRKKYSEAKLEAQTAYKGLENY